MFILSGFAIRRRFGQCVWAVGSAFVIAAAVGLAAADASAQGSAQASAQGSAQGSGNDAAALIPTSLQPFAAPPVPAGGPVAVGSEIATRLASGGLVIAGERLHGGLLRRFYAAHNYAPVWPTHQAQAAALFDAVLRAGDHGLDPNLFHAALLRNPAALSSVDRELLLSDAFLGFAEALARGVLPIEDRMDDEDLTPQPIDVAAVLDRAIGSPNPAAVIEALAPQSPAYIALQQALQRYRHAAAAGGPTAFEGPPGAAPRPVADGNDQARLREIEVNLERLRWLPRTLPPDRVWVNIANAQLVLYQGDKPVFTTRVVVGQTDKQTPEFHTTIDSVLYNPPWNVPSSITSSEILPKLSEDPDYLRRHHMVWRSNGAIQQVAGPYSALGRLKFEMADRFEVYLHDTPEKFLFKRSNRRQSHGCVRVQNPRELAALLLGQPVAAINRGIAVGYTNRRELPAPIAVFVVYQTAFLDANGALAFVPDVYNRDPEIWQRLHPAGQSPEARHDTFAPRRS